MTIIIHYGEIALKGGNRNYFESVLIKNIKSNLEKSTGLSFICKKIFGRLILQLEKKSLLNQDYQELEASAIKTLKKTFGIANFALVKVVTADINTIEKQIINDIKVKDYTTFRISARRADKSFPLNSQEINTRLGGEVVAKYGKKVNLDNPDLSIHVEIVGKIAYLYYEKIKGPGGLPVGVSGKALVLISGGFDSPVAAWYALRRGMQVEFIHFHSMPYTSKASLEKVASLVNVLETYGASNKIANIPFAEIQKKVLISCPEKLRVILYRRIMMRMSENLANKHNCKALVTGEAVGQVASQTLENLRATGIVTTLPIIRPLICFDKEDIMELATKIGTHDISKKPHDDACTRFIPDHPEIHANLKEVEQAEEKLDINTLLQPTKE